MYDRAMSARDTVMEKGTDPASPDKLTEPRSPSVVPVPPEKGDAAPASAPPPPSPGSPAEIQTSEDEDGDDDDAEYPEGGLQAWLVVLGSWLALFSALGLMNTLATFQAYVSTHQLADHSEGQIGWIFSLYTFLTFGGGIYIGAVFDKYGPRWVVLAGTICLVVSLVGFSFCTGTSAQSPVLIKLAAYPMGPTSS